jgi:SAM-dependent methyltransferase
MTIPTLLRRAECKALSTVTLSGEVIDLGGDKDAEYLSYIKGTFTVTALNIDPASKPDITHDLEQPMPIKDAQYDHALLMNVLEHMFKYRELLQETVRIIRPGGSIVVIVPFLFPIHPSPNDYWRFTQQTLQKEFELLSLSDISITPLGHGVFAARYVLLDRLLPNIVRAVNYYTFRYILQFLDTAFISLARVLGKKYIPSDYALGYMVVARKP